MTIALDGTPLAGPAGGIRRYTEELARALASEFPDDQVHTLVPEAGRWWTAGVQAAMRRVGANLFHGTDFAVPYLPLRASVMTVHDMTPFRREWRDEVSARVRSRAPWLIRLRVATMTVTPSKAVRAELIEAFGLNPARVTAVAHGVSAAFRPRECPAAAPFFLVAGAVHRRKNLRTAIDAWRAFGGTVRMVVAGDLRDTDPEPGVEYLGCVTDEQMAELYSGAVALLFPSLYEGFGLPLVEAMACGAPVVASTDPALQEVSGGAALHADPRDPGAWAEAIGAVIEDSELRGRMREAGLRRAACFTWQRCARETRAVYEEALRRHG